MTYRSTLREFAFGSHGVITTRDADALGVPPVELRKLAARGALTRIGHGVYRMTEAPTGPLDEFAEAVALAGEGAVLADESVLAALDLTPVNLRKIRVATRRRLRVKLPPTVEITTKTVKPEDREYLDGVPSMSVAAAIRGARGRIMNERLVEAVTSAAARGLIGRAQADTLLAELNR